MCKYIYIYIYEKNYKENLLKDLNFNIVMIYIIYRILVFINIGI